MRVLEILPRVYVNDLSAALPLYESLLGDKAGLRFSMPDLHLELASVRGLLLIGGSEEALRPFRQTSATFLVDDLDAYRSRLLAAGATIVRDRREVPTGWNLTARHPDGTVIEYVQHRTSG